MYVTYKFVCLYCSGLHCDAVWPCSRGCLHHGLQLPHVCSASIRRSPQQLRLQASVRITWQQADHAGLDKQGGKRQRGGGGGGRDHYPLDTKHHPNDAILTNISRYFWGRVIIPAYIERERGSVHLPLNCWEKHKWSKCIPYGTISRYKSKSYLVFNGFDICWEKWLSWLYV